MLTQLLDRILTAASLALHHLCRLLLALCAASGAVALVVAGLTYPLALERV